MKSKRIAGMLGLAGVLIFIAAAAVSIITFEDGAFSPLSGFVSDLGYYTGGYMSASSALVFNLGLIISGLCFGIFIIIYGLRSDAPFRTAVSFFGALTGLLMAAEGLFTLNYYRYHYILASSFFVSLLIMCVLFIVSKIKSGVKGGLFETIAALLAGIASALSAVYMITGGMAQVFSEDALGIGRANVIPFAATAWAAYALLLVFTATLSFRMLAQISDPEAKR